MIENFYPKKNDETNNEYLLRIGNLKESKQLDLTWDEIALIMNNNISAHHPLTESYWRKKYHRLTSEMQIPFYEEEEKKQPDNDNKSLFYNVEKQRIRMRDERNGYNRLLRSQARQDEILQLFQNEIHKYDKKQIPQFTKITNTQNDKSIYVMLSDIHYGISFNSISGKYDSEIASERIMKYAANIIDIGKECNICYVSLMGDMVSGNIHQSVRIENKENMIEQIVGVSELVAFFLYKLAENFECVYVNSVDGNHSRIDPNLENVLRNERYDSLIPWYCKAKLADIDNIIFVNNSIDSSIGSFEIYGLLYISVHGDLEKDLKVSAHNIEKMIGRHIDYMLAAHTHVPELRLEDTVYIRNGCVCGSGDDYTMKKRIFGPPSQVCMICSDRGIDSIYPVIL